jgi:hypothetical protein
MSRRYGLVFAAMLTWATAGVLVGSPQAAFSVIGVCSFTVVAVLVVESIGWRRRGGRVGAGLRPSLLGFDLC